MEERIIGIDNFLKYKIIKINEEYSTYIVIEWNKMYFEEVGEGILKIRSNKYYKPYNYALSSIIPYTKKNKNIADLEEAIYLLFQDIKYTMPRAEKGKYYYFVNTNFKVIKFPEEYEKFDNSQYNSFNYFLTEEKAINYAKILQENLIKLRKEDYLKGE